MEYILFFRSQSRRFNEENTVRLITYANRFGDGADAGFDPIDHTKVDPRLGSWDDVAELSKSHDIIVDAIVNHMSWESAQFQDVLKNGEKSEYYPMFLTMSSVFPNGVTEEDLAGICRPRGESRKSRAPRSFT